MPTTPSKRNLATATNTSKPSRANLSSERIIHRLIAARHTLPGDIKVLPVASEIRLPANDAQPNYKPIIPLPGCT